MSSERDARHDRCAAPFCGHLRMDHEYWTLTLLGKHGCDECKVEVSEHAFVEPAP